MNKTTIRNWGSAAGDTAKTADKAGKYRLASSLLALLCASMMAAPANAQAPPAPVDGVMILNGRTIPMGGVWLINSAGVGHYWDTDTANGIARTDPAINQNPPWQLTNPGGTVAAGGQAVVAPMGPNFPRAGVPAGATQFVFVADAATKSTSVVRFIYDPVRDQLTQPLILSVPNVAAAHGGAQGGRPDALALSPKVNLNGGFDLYVGYTKSGDIMMAADATNTNSKTPVVTQIGETSDTIGVRSLAFHKNDLYLAEMGGFGLSRIQDPAGVARTSCGAPNAVCTAVTLSPNVSSFPGGLVSDGTFLYIGDSPLTTSGSILKYNPTTFAVNTYSQNVPAYTSNFDGVTRSQYRNPFGLTLAPNGDLYVADDPTAQLVIPVLPTLQGHLWKVPVAPAPPTITNLSLNQGVLAGNEAVTISGNGFAIDTITTIGAVRTQTPNTIFMFGNGQANGVSCLSVTSCVMTTPSSAGPGVVDVQAFVGGQVSPIVPADVFTYVANSPLGAPVVTKITPASGVLGGGTVVTINGTSLAGGFVTFGVTAAASVSCTADGLSCTATSPAGTGTIDVQVTNGQALTSAPVPSDRFTYASPTASIFAWGITAPKGGMVWVPGALGGHWWSSDHSAGFCRQDAVAGSTLHALDPGNCDDGSIGSSGQAVYDPRVNPDGNHYIYVPDNAVKSTAIWRLTFNPVTERLVGLPEAMIPLADVRTLKPNGMAMGPGPDFSLFVSDLTEMNIRKVTGANGDPRSQTVSIVAVTGDGRGANGTMGFIDNKLYVSENRAAASFDITSDCALGRTGIPCTTVPIPLPSGAFVAGVATDNVNKLVYASDSPGGANATIWRHNPATGQTSLYLQGGIAPAAGTPNATVWCTQTCTRPWDPAWTPGGLGGFSFVFGLATDPVNGNLYVTEDHTAGNRGGRGTAWMAPFIP